MLTLEGLGKFKIILSIRRNGFNISTAAKQIDTLGIGSFIKIVFKSGPPKTNKNPCG